MWALIIIFMMNGSGHLTSQQITGFKSSTLCAAVGKELEVEYPNHPKVQNGKLELTLSWVCVEIK